MSIVIHLSTKMPLNCPTIKKTVVDPALIRAYGVLDYNVSVIHCLGFDILFLMNFFDDFIYCFIFHNHGPK
jgi:hypothetical protein